MSDKFIIENDSAADWAVQKIIEKRAEKQKWQDYYAEQLEKINSQCDADIAHFEGLLLSYFVDVPSKDTKTQKSYQLPSGKLVYKKPSTEYVRDKATLLAWAKANNTDFVKVEESARWEDIKKHIKDTGELPDGVEVVESEGRFEVKI